MYAKRRLSNSDWHNATSMASAAALLDWLLYVGLVEISCGSPDDAEGAWVRQQVRIIDIPSNHFTHLTKAAGSPLE